MDREQVVLVTGAAQGIGRGLVEAFLARGLAVAAVDCNGERLAAASAADDPQQLLTIAADISDEAAVAAMVDRTLTRFGRINALINNAAIATATSGPPEALDLQIWQRILDVNLTGAFLCCKHAIPALRASGRGAIVNIASTRAVQSEPLCEAYAASKGGIVALTHALAISLGPAIRVNCISPGWIADPDQHPHFSVRDHAQHPAGRVGLPADIAGLAAFLIGAEAGFITGQNFIVDGGMTRRMLYAE